MILCYDIHTIIFNYFEFVSKHKYRLINKSMNKLQIINLYSISYIYINDNLKFTYINSLTNLTLLYANNTIINDNGILMCTNLEDLCISNKSNISNFNNFSNLTYLDIDNNQNITNTHLINCNKLVKL